MLRSLATILIGVLMATPALASGGACDALPGTGLGDLSLLWVIPFAGLLLSIAVVPMVAGHWWHHNRNQLITAVAWALPVFGYLLFLVFTDDGRLGCEAGQGIVHAVIEYVSFIALLGSLFIISGGILLKGDLQGKPIVNTGFLLIGAIISNIIGTTGASMLLIQPMLRTNAERKHTWHIPLFFIFLVSNVGGALTPIGDPPLFLGYLRGVDFFWTLTHLWWIWVPTVAMLIGMFFVTDTIMYRREDEAAKTVDAANVEPLGIEGGINFALLAGVIVAVLFLSPVSHSGDSHDGEHASLDPATDAAALHEPAGLDAYSSGSWLGTPAAAAPEDGGGGAEAEHGEAGDHAHTDEAHAEHTDEAGAAHHEGGEHADTDHHGEEGHAHADGAATEHGEDGQHAAAGTAHDEHAGEHGDEHGDGAHHADPHEEGSWSLDPRDYFLREIVMALLAGLSLWVTSKRIRERNKFEYGPILEVAALFVGIFVAMVPATAMLQANGDQLGLTEPWQFFWMTGGLSAFLDNAPTYVTFASVACGIDPTCVSANDLSPLTVGDSMPILMAISLGAVFLGAGSYIGNGPNFMVRAIAENYTMEVRSKDEDGEEVVETVHPFKMPSFFGYIGYAAMFLLPVFIIVSIIGLVFMV